MREPRVNADRRCRPIPSPDAATTGIARENHDDRPRGGQFDHHRATVARPQLTVQAEDICMNRSSSRTVCSTSKVDGCTYVRIASPSLRTITRAACAGDVGNSYPLNREPGFAASAAAICSAATGRVPDNIQVIVRCVDPSFDLRLEQVDSAADRQNDHERNAQQTGIKMPAPHGAVIGPRSGLAACSLSAISFGLTCARVARIKRNRGSHCHSGCAGCGVAWCRCCH